MDKEGDSPKNPQNQKNPIIPRPVGKEKGSELISKANKEKKTHD